MEDEEQDGAEDKVMEAIAWQYLIAAPHILTTCNTPTDSAEVCQANLDAEMIGKLLPHRVERLFAHRNFRSTFGV